MHCTHSSDLRIGAAMDHAIDGPVGTDVDQESIDDLARVTITADVAPGTPLRVVKFLSYGWSGERSRRGHPRPGERGARRARCDGGWEELLAEQRSYLDSFWDRADVELDGDAELQQAARFALFHILQAGARGEKRPIAAKGLTGPGYDGHTFWDTESFVLPVLTYTSPRAAARCAALATPHARPRARAREPAGARGRRLPLAHDRGKGVLELLAGRHRRVSHQRRHRRCRRALLRRPPATTSFEHEAGTDAAGRDRAVVALTGPSRRGRRFRIDGVTGPDEYSAIADNNVYTNLMAQRNLRAAADAAERHPATGDRAGRRS